VAFWPRRSKNRFIELADKVPARRFVAIFREIIDAGDPMRHPIRVFAAAALSAAIFIPAARAQDMTTATFNGTTIWVGGGFQYLSLPDIKLTGHAQVPAPLQVDSFRPQKNSDFSEYGGGGGAGIETAVGYWNGMRMTAGVKGFFTSLENSDSKPCAASGDLACVALDPTGSDGIVLQNGSFVTKTDRDVDYWGGQVELKFGGGQPVHAKPNLYRNDYFIIGADIRGIDQDNGLVSHTNLLPGNGLLFTYRETLDTTYVGGYIGLGGEYSFGFLGVGGLYDRFGLRTFINARGGLYSAETDYHGRYAIPDVGFNTALSKSNDELAFIGTVSLETRKQIGMRTSLSLWSDYEYISSVPKMRYPSEIGQTARIDDDSAFATRTMLRLNIGLGSAQLYDEPLK
jgi:hypothetical protein